MATRFYLPSAGVADISPGFDATWNDFSQAVRLPTSHVKGSTGFLDFQDSEQSPELTHDICLGQFVSAPLASQTISGTVNGIIRARQGSGNANTRSQMVVRVVSGDGTVLRGTLLPANDSTVNEFEWVTSGTARTIRFPAGNGPATLSSLAVENGDRLVIEVGGRTINDLTTSYQIHLRFGEAGGDLPDNTTTTTDGAPWIEFSQDLLFAGATPSAQNLSANTNAQCHRADHLYHYQG